MCLVWWSTGPQVDLSTEVNNCACGKDVHAGKVQWMRHGFTRKCLGPCPRNGKNSPYITMLWEVVSRNNGCFHH